MGSRTSNGNTRDPRGQEKGKGRSYYGDLDQDFDGAVGDESRDEIDLLYDERNPRHSTPLPSIPKKSSGMKAKNGLKVGDEIVDVDIEEVKKTNQKKKKKTQEVSSDFRMFEMLLPEKKALSYVLKTSFYLSSFSRICPFDFAGRGSCGSFFLQGIRASNFFQWLFCKIQ